MVKVCSYGMLWAVMGPLDMSYVLQIWGAGSQMIFTVCVISSSPHLCEVNPLLAWLTHMVVD